MPFSGRELVLILRATNQASGPLRQVGRDLRSLGRGGTQAFNQMSAAQERSIRNWQRIGTAGAVIRDTGRVARLGGIAIGAGLGFAAKGYAEFNTQTGLAATQTGSFNKAIGRTTEEVARNADIIEKGILQQMRAFPASAKEMTDATYEIFSSTNLGSQGLRGLTKGLKLLNVMNKAAVAGQADLSDVTKAATSIMNAFKTPVKDMPRIFQRVFAGVRFGRMTFADFIGTFSQIVPATKAANQSFDTMVGTMASLTRVLPNVRMAATAYARLLEIIGRRAFVTGMAKLGHSITDAHGKLIPLPKMIEKFNRVIADQPEKERAGWLRNFAKEVTKFGEGTKSGFEGTIQMRRALISLMTDMPQYRHVLGQVSKDNTEFTKSFQIMAKRAGVQWDTFMNKMKAAWLAVGAAAIPILMALLDPIRQIAEAFADLDTEQRTQIVRWLAIAAAVLIVGGTLTKIFGSLMSFVGHFKAAGYSLTVFAAGAVAIAAVLLLLIGRGDLVHAAFDNLFDAATSSTRNLIIAITALSVAMFRLQSAAVMPLFLGLRARGAAAGTGLQKYFSGIQSSIKATSTEARRAQAVLAGMTAAGMVTRGPGGKIARLAEVKQIREAANASVKASRTASIMRGAFAGAAASVALLPAPLLITAGLVAAVAGSAWLISRHFDAARKKAEQLAVAQRRFAFLGARPTQAAAGLRDVGPQTIDARRAALNLQQMDLQIKQLRKSMQAATGDERKLLSNQLQIAILDRAQAYGDWRLAVNNLAITSQRFQGVLRGQANILQGITLRENQLSRLNQLRDALTGVSNIPRQKIDALLNSLGMRAWQPMELGSSVLARINQRIASITSGITDLQLKSAGAARTLKNSFSSIVRDFQQARMLPQQIPKGAIESMVRLATAKGRMLTLPEMRAVINATLSQASLRKMPADIQRAVGLVKIEAWLETRQKKVTDLKTQLQRAMHSGDPEAAQEIRVKLAGAQNALRSARTAHTRIAKAFSKTINQQVAVNISPPVGAMYNIGLQIANGVAHGIIGGIPAVQRAGAALAYAASSSAAGAARAKSPSLLMAETVGLPLAQGVVKGLKQGTPDLILAGSEMIELFAGKVISDLQAASISIEFFSSKFLQDLEENIAEAKDKLSDARKTNDAEARKFIGQKITPAALTRDMAIQAEQITAFVSSIARLNRRGVPRELLNQLRELGQEGGEKLRILANASDRELKRYVAAWRRAQEAVRRFSRITAQDLIKDIQSQGAALKAMNADLTRLAAKGVPAIILAQLAKLGIEGAAQVKTLASMTKAQLKAWIAAWYAANAQLRKLMSLAQYEEILQQNQDFFDRLFDPMELVQRVKSMAEEVKSAFIQAFGTLFSDAIRSRVGASFTDALADWNSQMAGLQRELSDAYNELAKENANYQAELAKAQADAVRERAQELQQQFGALFAGDWLKDRLDWRKALKMKDLKRDLQEQINAFKDWRGSLATLASRAIPAGLLKGLEELGIENRDLIRILAKSTDQELQEYIDLWQQGQAQINDIAKTATADTSEITARHVEAVAGIMQRIQEINERMAALQAQKPKPLTFEDILGDLAAQKAAFEDWIGTLETLRKRNVPAALLQQLRELGPEAVEILRILATATDEELLRYIALWQSAGVAIGAAVDTWADAITAEEILTGMRKQVDEFQKWQAAMSALMGKVLSDGTKIPAALIDTLRKLGPEALPYLQALIGMTKEQLDEFVALWKTGQAEITAASRKEWIENGKALAKGFIQGLAEASPAMAAALGITLTDVGQQGATLAHQPWFNEGISLMGKVSEGINFTKPAFISNLQQFLTDTQPIIDHITPFWQGVGSSMADSIGGAFISQWSTWADRIRAIVGGVTPPPPPTSEPGAGLAGASTSGGPTFNQTVNAHHSESLMSTLERATFRLRNA